MHRAALVWQGLAVSVDSDKLLYRKLIENVGAPIVQYCTEVHKHKNNDD